MPVILYDGIAHQSDISISYHVLLLQLEPSAFLLCLGSQSFFDLGVPNIFISIINSPTHC